MRICLYTDTALPKLGGQEFVVDALARQFLHAGHDVTVLAPRPRRRLQASADTFPYHTQRHPRFFSTRLFVAWYRRWLCQLHRYRPFDILHCHGIYPPGYLAALCRARLGVPTVITSHGGDVEIKPRQTKACLRKRYVRALEASDALIAISQATYDGLARLSPQTDKIVHIPNGVDLDVAATLAARPSDLDQGIRPGEYALFLGRLKQRKGVDLLLEALALAPNPNVQAVVVGGGEERPRLEAQARSLGLGQRVHFVGAVFGAAKAYLLQNALCTVMPSRLSEAFPLVVLESYASGVPVIGTRIPGLGELVKPGKTGLLVESGAPEELARALMHCFSDREACRRMGVQARALAQAYSWTKVAQKHLALYQALCATGSCREVHSWRVMTEPSNLRAAATVAPADLDRTPVKH